MTFGRPPMVVWPTVVSFPAAVDDEMLSTQSGSVREPLPSQEFSMLAFFVHALELTRILMRVLKYVGDFPVHHRAY
jgi:hypothetical protein